MKRTLILIVGMIFLLSACGYREARLAYYQTQQELIKAQYGFGSYKAPAAPPKTFDLQLDDQGRVKAISMNVEPLLHPQNRIALTDIKPPADPWPVKVWKDTIYSPVAQVVAGFWGAGYFAHEIGRNSGHNTTTTGSYNNGSYNSSGGGPMGITTGAGNAAIARDTITTTSNDSHNIADSYNDSSDNSTSSVADSNNTDNSQHDSGWTDDNSDNSRWSDDHSDNRQDFNNQQDDNRQDFNKPDNRYNYDNPQTTP